jgi:hypothetical protein
MMRSWKWAVFAAVILLVASPAYSQDVSETDTIRVVDAYGDPGDSVAIQLYLRNTIDVGGLNFLLHFDSTYLSPAYNWAEIINYGDTSGPVWYEMINRGWDTDEDLPNFRYNQNVNSLDTTSTLGHIVSGIFVGNPLESDDIPVGSGTFVQFWVHIKPYAPEGEEIDIILYDEQISGGRQNEFYDPEGMTGVKPTLRSGTVFVGTAPPPGTNHTPYFSQPSQTVYNVNTNDLVQFTVAASDQDAGQALILRMLSGPSGSTFAQTTGSGSISNVFSWTPNYSQVGAFTARFQVTDDSSASAERTVTINVTAPQIDEDQIYTTSKEGPGNFIQGGIPGASDVAVPVNLQDRNTLYGVQFDFTYNSSMMRLDSVVATDRLAGFEVYSDAVGAGVVRMIAFGLNNEFVAPAVTSDAIFYCWFTIYASATPGRYEFELANGRASISPDPGQGSIDVVVDPIGFVSVDALGDVNLDSRVDVDDLVKVVSYIIGEFPLSTRQFRAGDINTDTYVNVVDLVGIINLIFTGPFGSPVPKGLFAGGTAELGIGLSDGISDGFGTLAITADLPTDVAGAQFELVYDPDEIELGNPELTERSDGFKLQYRDYGGRLRILMFFDPSNRDRVIPSGLGDIIRIPATAIGGSAFDAGQILLDNPVLSDPSGQEIEIETKQVQLPLSFSLQQNYPNPFNPSTNIRFSIDGTQILSVQVVIHNILGQRVATLLETELGPGDYEITWDGTGSSGEKQASGVYFYSLSVGERRETKKMVLSK